MNLDGLILNKSKFTKMIEKTVQTKRLSYLDAVVHLCEENNIEIDDVRKYISQVVKDKIEVEAQNLNFIPKGNTLTFE
jgi:hypothetical protein|tara:strand:- start:1177 stop:1410 length:234 start_codon:yes stop_codon:yes gene_type:complete